MTATSYALPTDPTERNIIIENITKIANAYGRLNTNMTYIQALHFLYDQAAPAEAIKIAHDTLKGEYGTHPERPNLTLNLASKLGSTQQDLRHIFKDIRSHRR